MILLLIATLLVVAALLWELGAPSMARLLASRRSDRGRGSREPYDPGRERRAEQRARDLLRSCVGVEEWAMYRDLGFIRVWGRLADGPVGGVTRATEGGAPYAYLVYPQKPIVSFLPQTRQLLAEYCVAFPDETRPFGSSRLPDSDDVLAKWMALSGDERLLIDRANMGVPGRQIDPRKVHRDLCRLGDWERTRLEYGREQMPAG